MRRLSNKFFIIITGFYIFWLLVLPLILTGCANFVCKCFTDNTKYEITLEKPAFRLSVLPILKFSAEAITVKSKSSSIYTNIKNPKICIRILPLLAKNVHINSLKIDDFEYSEIIQGKLRLNRNFIQNLENSIVTVDSVNIKKFNINVYSKNVKKPINYSGNNFVYCCKNRFVKFHVNSILKVKSKKSDINLNLYFPKNNDINKTIFDVDVENLDLSDLQSYLSYYLPQDLKELSGFINVKADKDRLVTNFTNCKCINKDNAKSIIFPKQLTINSSFTINNKYISFDCVEIKAPNINISLKGKILDYFGKTIPTLDFNICINKSRLETLTDLLPAFKTEDVDVYKLKKYKFYADTMGNLTIKGRLPEPDIKGSVLIDNGILIKPIPNTLKGATVKLSFLGRYLKFDVSVPAGFEERVWVNGGVELYNVKYSNMIVKSTENVDLKVTQNVVNPLHEILNFVTGPVPIMDIKGKGNINIKIKGNRQYPHIWGDLNFKNATLSFLDFPEIKQLNATSCVKFDDEKAEYITKSGTVNGQLFDVHGTSSLAGKFDFYIKSSNQPTKIMYNAISASTLIPEFKNMLPKFDNIKGNTDINLNVYGNLKYIEDLSFNKNFFVKGNIFTKNNSVDFQGINISNINAKISLDGLNLLTAIKAKIADNPLSVNAKIKNEIADIILNIPQLNMNFLLKPASLANKQYLPVISLKAKYNGSIQNIEYDKLNLYAKCLYSNPHSDVQIKSGEIYIKDGIAEIKNFVGYMFSAQNLFNINLKVNNTFFGEPRYNGKIHIKTSNLKFLNNIFTFELLPKKIKYYFKDYEFNNGPADLNIVFKNNKIFLNTALDDISFTYIPKNLPITILNGNLNMKNNVLYFDKVNILADKMPLLIDGKIRELFDKNIFELYFNSKPQQEFIDKYVNKNRIYPIKIKGDIICKGNIDGTKDDFDIKTTVNLEKGASIYHYGATVGDIENEISLYLASKVIDNNIFKIDKFAYDKIISSQNGKPTRLNMLTSFGEVSLANNDVEFKNLHIKTDHPTDARIFNIIFRKSNIKEGQFTSDLKMNGSLSNPKIIGNFHIVETNIPFLDTTMKNIELVFKDKIIEISSRGDIMGNAISIDGIMKNDLQQPYKIENAVIYTKYLNLNRIINKIKSTQIDNPQALISSDKINLCLVLFNNVKLIADNVELRNIHATDFKALISNDANGTFKVNAFNFNIANGKLFGKYEYNSKNNNVKINLKADSINANDITYALFNLDNQIHGNLTGKINLSCNGNDFDSCMQTLNGSTKFNVKNGQMPKLGSLEYLLKAGNLVKGGITNLSINGVIDLITPLKTGEFSDITGDIQIADGVTKNIDILTAGKDLSLYITGEYNFRSSMAEMQVYGILARKLSTMLGAVGNMSINTLFNVIPGVNLANDTELRNKINKIPGLELSSKAYRKFIANIKGNINGDNYVKSFEWIN